MQINSTYFLAWNFAFFPRQDRNYSKNCRSTGFYFTVTLYYCYEFFFYTTHGTQNILLTHVLVCCFTVLVLSVTVLVLVLSLTVVVLAITVLLTANWFEWCFTAPSAEICHISCRQIESVMTSRTLPISSTGATLASTKYHTSIATATNKLLCMCCAF